MNPLVVSRRKIAGFESLKLSNAAIEADIIPALGGKIWNLLHIPTKTQWIWHNPNVPLKSVSADANYDDNWAGGWEELFPNDAKGPFQGRELPDHGEWWSREWAWEVLDESPKKVTIKLILNCKSLKSRCEKWITLEAGASKIDVSYRITNLEPSEIHFLFKQHLALALGPKHRLELPGGRVTPVDLGFSTRIKTPGEFSWPGQNPDLSELPPAKQKHQEFAYVSDLPEGWCGARDTKTGASIRMTFDRAVFPYTWLFMTFGSWRGLYTVVLEPCTNMPKDINEAFRRKQCASLGPKKSLETSVSVALS